MVPTGVNTPVISRDEYLMYLGEWLYLEAHKDVKQWVIFFIQEKFSSISTISVDVMVVFE